MARGIRVHSNLTICYRVQPQQPPLFLTHYNKYSNQLYAKYAK
jgi:hypothetical protein